MKTTGHPKIHGRTAHVSRFRQPRDHPTTCKDIACADAVVVMWYMLEVAYSARRARQD